MHTRVEMCLLRGLRRRGLFPAYVTDVLQRLSLEIVDSAVYFDVVFWWVPAFVRHRTVTCPTSTASWLRKGNNANTHYTEAECANNGICNRVTGVCKCFKGFTGAACSKSTWIVDFQVPLAEPLHTTTVRTCLRLQCPAPMTAVATDDV
jgi:hypothetical protein